MHINMYIKCQRGILLPSTSRTEWTSDRVHLLTNYLKAHVTANLS